MRAFFFSIIIFLILGYILLSISAWTASVQINEQHLGERFALKNAQNVLDQVSENEVKRIVHIIAYNSLYKLNEQATKGLAIKEDPAKDEFYYINRSMYQLITTGEADGDNFNDGIPVELPGDHLNVWFEKLKISLRETGYGIESYEPYDFSIKQDSANSVSYSMKIRLRIEGKEGRIFTDRIYEIHDSIDLSGFVDPLIYREGYLQAGEDELILQKQFFFNENYPGVKEVNWSMKLEQEGIAGQGWFYGRLITVDEILEEGKLDGRDPREIANYILVGTYEDITESLTEDYIQYDDFSAYILTNEPGLTDSGCGSGNVQSETATFNPIVYDASCIATINQENEAYMPKPFAVIPGFTPEDVGEPLDNENEHAVLFVAQYDHGQILSEPGRKNNQKVLLFNIENIRDFVLCGYYTQNSNSPSYLQRLIGGYDKKSQYGIETMLVGSYIGGEGEDAPAPANVFKDEESSRLDRELFTSVPGIVEKIRGMPGCRSSGTCASISPIGHFRLGTYNGEPKGAIEDYRLEEIRCNNGFANCG